MLVGTQRIMMMIGIGMGLACAGLWLNLLGSGWSWLELGLA